MIGAFRRRSFRVEALLVVVAMVVLHVGIRAEPRTGFVEHLGEVRVLTEKLQRLNRKNLNIKGLVDEEFELQDEIVSLVWSYDSSERGGASMQTNSTWLLFDLFQLQRGDTDRENRERIMTGVLMRIDTALAIVAEAERRSDSPVADTDSDVLTEILSGNEFDTNVSGETSVVRDLLNKLSEWLRSLFPDGPLFTPSEDVSGSSSAALRVFLWIAGSLTALFLIWRFRRTIFRWWVPNHGGFDGDRIVLGETIGDETSAEDLFKEAENLAAIGDVRAAIRKGYIALICDLGDRRFVTISRNKTNQDYLREVSGNEIVFATTERMTRIFEQHWYGLQPSDMKDWEDFRGTYAAMTRG